MSETTIAIMTEAEKLAAVADAIGASFARELAFVLRDLERDLRRLALDALEGNRSALSRAVRAARIRVQIQRALTAAGFDALADTATGPALDRLVTQLERLRLAGKLKAFTSADMTRILALKELARLNVLGLGPTIAQALWRTAMYGIVTQRKAADLLTDLADALDGEVSEARTLYDTTVSVFGRQVEAMKAVEGDVFAYMGPVDSKIRPFCRKHVGRVYTREQIDALDNGQLPSVYLTGGGYNCRHTWQAVSKISELRDLVGTDQRIPEIEAALQRAPVPLRKKAA